MGFLENWVLTPLNSVAPTGTSRDSRTRGWDGAISCSPHSLNKGGKGASMRGRATGPHDKVSNREKDVGILPGFMSWLL